MTVATPTGRTLQLPPPAPADLAAAMAEACIRLALARIKQGELAGRAIPEPAAVWSIRWDRVNSWSVLLTIEARDELDDDAKTAVIARLSDLDIVATLARADRGYEFSARLLIGEVGE